MPVSRFCLQWDNHSKNLSSNLRKLYENQHCVDLKLLCETHSIGVHKCVLAACSPYFADRFTKSLDIVSVIMKGVEYPVIKSILEFMYTGETNVIEEYVNAVVEAAKFFKVRGLSGIVTEKIGISEIMKGSKLIEEPEFITRNHSVVDFTNNKLNDNNLSDTNIDNCEKNIDELLLLDDTRPELTEQLSLIQNNHSLKNTVEQPETQLPLNNSSFNNNNCSKLVNSDIKIISNIGYKSLVNKKQNVLEEHVSDLTDNLYIKDVNEIQNCDPILNLSNDDTFVSSNEMVPEDNEMLSSDMSLVAIASQVMNSSEHIKINKIDNDLTNSILSNEIIENSSIEQNELQSVSKSSKMMKLLQNAGIPTDVPVFYEEKNGKYVQLSEKILDEIANGYQVIYQIIDEDGNPSELMLGNTNKQVLKSQKQDLVEVIYDKLVVDVSNNENDETSLDMKDHICIEESIVAANEFLVHSDSQDEQMGFLVTTSDIVEGDKIMFQDNEEISLEENCPIISDVIETIKDDILSEDNQNIVKKNKDNFEQTKLLELCTNESTDESLCTLKSKPLSILLTASDMIENKQVVIDENDKINLNDNCNIVFMEHIDMYSKENGILENNLKSYSEKSNEFNEIHLEKTSDFDESDNEIDSLSQKKDPKINLGDKSECTEKIESDIHSSPEKLDSYELNLLSKKKKNLNNSTSSKSTDDSSSDYRSESESQTVIYESSKNNLFQKNSISVEVSSCIETSDNYVSSREPSKDSSTSFSSISPSETERTPIRNHLCENIPVDEGNDSVENSLSSIHKTISTLNSVDYISILGLDKNLLTPSSIDISEENQPNLLKNYIQDELKEDHVENKSLHENSTNKLTSNISINENLQDSLVISNSEINTDSLHEGYRDCIQESVEQKMARLHMEISISDSNPNTLFEEIQKLTNSKKENVLENQNPFTDSDMSEYNVQITDIGDKSIELKSTYDKYMEITDLEQNKNLKEDDSNKEILVSDSSPNTLLEEIQKLKNSRKRSISENRNPICDVDVCEYNLQITDDELVETKSKYDKYLQITHSKRKKHMKEDEQNKEISVSNSSPNTLFEEIQKFKNSRIRSISENRNPISDSDTSDYSVQITDLDDKSIESKTKGNNYLQMKHSKRKKNIDEDEQNKETLSENTNRFSEDIQQINHNQTKKLIELPKESLKPDRTCFNISETKSKYANYLKVTHSNKRKLFQRENVINNTEMNADNSINIQEQSVNLKKLNSNKPSNVRSIDKSNLINIKRTRLRESSGSASDNSIKTGKEIPYALGLLPLNKALKKIQNMPEHKPRKTRSGIKLTKYKTIQNEDTKQKLSSKIINPKLKLNVHRERIIKKTK